GGWVFPELDASVRPFLSPMPSFVLLDDSVPFGQVFGTTGRPSASRSEGATPGGAAPPLGISCRARAGDRPPPGRLAAGPGSSLRLVQRRWAGVWARPPSTSQRRSAPRLQGARVSARNQPGKRVFGVRQVREEAGSGCGRSGKRGSSGPGSRL